MSTLQPVTGSQVEAKGSKGRIDVIAGARKKSKLVLYEEREQLKKDLAIPLDKAERKSLMEREDDVKSDKSEGDIPYVDFDDFVDQIANRLRFGKKWTTQQQYFEWNRLVLDKA